MKTLLTIKTDKELKETAQEVAGELGFPLGTLVNAYLRQIVHTRMVAFRAPLVPNEKTARMLRKRLADAKAGRNMVGPFSTTAEQNAWLDR